MVDLNTCLETTRDYHTIAFYSHLIPIAIGLVLSIFVLFRTKFSKVAQIFFLFNTIVFLWLLGDLVTWVSPNYHLVNAAWSILDFLNILFYVVGTYFFIFLLQEKESPLWQKVLLFSLIIPAWWVTFNNQSILEFNQPVCEAYENDLLTKYKLIVEAICIFIIAGFGIVKAFHADRLQKIRIATVAAALILFLSVFSVTEYIATQTDVYEINLYGLFVLPVFLLVIIFSITRLQIFNTKTLGTRLLVYVLLILVGSQFFFLKDTTDQTLTVVTFLISLVLSYFLNQSVKREVVLREQLEIANKRQQETLRFITHEVKGYLTDGAAAFDAILSNTFGSVNDDMRGMLNEAMVKNRNAIREIQNFLRIADFKTGKVNYARVQFDFKRDLESALHPIAEHATAKNLTFTSDIAPADYTMIGDADQLVNHVIGNLVNNSINYTQKGSIAVRVERKADSVLFSVKDTGVGLTEEDKAVLFTEGGHGKESRTVNPHSTGYGLFIAKQIVDAHHGRMWAESAGRGTGSTFFVELPTNLRPTLSGVAQK